MLKSSDCILINEVGSRFAKRDYVEAPSGKANKCTHKKIHSWDE